MKSERTSRRRFGSGNASNAECEPRLPSEEELLREILRDEGEITEELLKKYGLGRIPAYLLEEIVFTLKKK